MLVSVVAPTPHVGPCGGSPVHRGLRGPARGSDRMESIVVLTKDELIAALQKEVRILLHLVDKIDRAQLDYRPTSKQRSTLELLRYLSVMGPGLIQASLTGHLVFSTLHTNDAPSSITRLRDMGVEPFLITATVEAIEAQRLVRKVCQVCKKSYDPTPEQMMEINLTKEQVKGRPLARIRTSLIRSSMPAMPSYWPRMISVGTRIFSGSITGRLPAFTSVTSNWMSVEFSLGRSPTVERSGHDSSLVRSSSIVTDRRLKQSSHSTRTSADASPRGAHDSVAR